MGCICFKQSLEVEGVKYKVIRHLADGGFSSVDLVENIRTGKKFAVKRITCHSIEDQNVAKQEIEINKRYSKHPNIITLVGSVLSGSADIVHNVTSEVILVFPFFERGSLHDELERRKLTGNPLSQASLLSMFHSLCQAVRELHQAEPPLAHRDIKVCLSALIHDFSQPLPISQTLDNNSILYWYIFIYVGRNLFKKLVPYQPQ